MRLEPFALERMQSTWENRVAWNLSESGVHPLRVEELATTDSDRMAVLSQDLGYPQTNDSGAAGGNRIPVSRRLRRAHRSYERRFGGEPRRSLAPHRSRR